MLKGRATPAATSAYAKQFASESGNFRPILDGVVTSSIGLGTYLGDPDPATDRSYAQAIEIALLGGVNLIDTAVNYRFQRSERVIGEVLAKLAASARIARDQVVIATKGGYLTFDGEMPANPRAYFADTYVKTGLIKPAELVDGSHCIAPRYIDAMVALSRKNLGLETIDIYYLHNPESQLGAVDRRQFLARLRAAFETLESRAARGEIGVYGAATWNGFRADPQDTTYLSLAEMVEAAVEVGGKDHHFRVIQLPYNLAMAEALAVSNQRIGDGQGSILDAARHYGIAVCASASILQGRLAGALPPMVSDAFAGLQTSAQRSIQFVRSTPGIDVALIGMKSAAHVRENLTVAQVPLAPHDAIMKLFQRAEG